MRNNTSDKQIYLLTRQLVHLSTLEKEVRGYPELTYKYTLPYSLLSLHLVRTHSKLFLEASREIGR